MAPKKQATLTRAGLPADYGAFLESLKARVRQAQTKAALSVNRELIQLYWDIGRLIVDRQEQEGWGKSIVDRLAGDLQKAFPGVGGFSPSNISRARTFFLAYRQAQNSAQAVPKLSVVDDQMRHAADAPTIGLILCKTHDRITAEYALRDIAKPIGVAEWQTKLVHALPESLKGSLPSIEEIEAELGGAAPI